MGNDQATNRVVRYNTTGIANDVSLAGLKAEKILNIKSGVHAGHNGDMPGWLDWLFSWISWFMDRLTTCIELIVCQVLIGVQIRHDYVSL